ncbi:MAG: hypothetical protein GEV08_23240 [Acidimicrobiia bacterium]|nr:hypothetical protein [Acidimicrobiia bacterium]
MSGPTDLAPNGAPPADPQLRRALGLDADPIAAPAGPRLFSGEPAAPADRDASDWGRVTGHQQPAHQQPGHQQPGHQPSAHVGHSPHGGHPGHAGQGGHGTAGGPHLPPVPPAAPAHPAPTGPSRSAPAPASNRLPVHVPPTEEDDLLVELKESVKDELLARLGHRL